MSFQRRRLWFWQTHVTSHMVGLAAAIAHYGCDVVYIANQAVADHRARQGWVLPDLGAARLEYATTVAEVGALVARAPIDAIHICQGLRGNGLVSEAQRALARQKLRQWVVMETVEDSGWRGALKRFEYGRLLRHSGRHLQGFLATGYGTPGWVVARGVPEARAYPFAYFLPSVLVPSVQVPVSGACYRLIFVGQLIERKRLDLLISALCRLNRADIELTVIGAGPLADTLRALGGAALPGSVKWIGPLPMAEVPAHMAAADCLVLPSRFDGWGAVVSEALMVGTPAICSDRCGAAGVVRASGYGGVFGAGDLDALTHQLHAAVARGPLSTTARSGLAAWARCLTAEAGARYLLRILEHGDGFANRPPAPWEEAGP